MASFSKFDLCNSALSRISANAITSFEDGTTESNVAGREYDQTVEHLLGEHRWRFATKQSTPNKLTEAPTDEWQAFFQMPADCLALQAVKVNSLPIEFDRYEDKIACDADAVTIDYTCRPDESQWPPHFRELVILKLEAIFTKSIRRDATLGASMEQEISRVHFPRCRSTDAQQQSARRLPPSRILARRRGH